MTTTSWSTLRNQLIAEPALTGPDIEDRLGYRFSAATIGNTSLTTTDTNLVRMGSSYDTNRFQGWHVWLETAGEDREVTTISISGSTVTMNFLGGNATNQASATNVTLLRISNSELQAAANDCLEFIPVECPVPLRHGPDSADMQGSTVDADWTETNATDTVQTTAAEVQFGQQSLVVANSGANGYTQSSQGRIAHGETVVFHALAKADTGTAEFAVFDDSGNEEDSVTSTQEDWVYMKTVVTFGSTDEGCYVRLRGDGASDSIDWNAAWWVRQSVNLFRLPTWIDQRFKIRLEARRYTFGGDEADTWLADAWEPVTLEEGRDWRFVNQYSDANPVMLWVDRQWLSWPLWVMVQAPASAPYGVSTTFSTDASTTTADVHVLTAALKQWLGRQYKRLWPEAEATGRREYEDRLKARMSIPAPKAPLVLNFFGH